MQQHLLYKAKTILVEVDTLCADAPWNCSPPGDFELCKKVNTHLAEIDKAMAMIVSIDGVASPLVKTLMAWLNMADPDDWDVITLQEPYLNEKAKNQHWVDWLENIDARQIHTANKYLVQEPTAFPSNRIPELKTTVDQALEWATSNEEKAKVQAESLFPPSPTSLELPSTAYCLLPGRWFFNCKCILSTIA
ncbi:hypothetical protein E4T56_gene13863 [Termitomyces sp. T112]|nr:hypothetical protein E4T56_gene13863 [Termitomyces sp. T112]